MSSDDLKTKETETSTVSKYTEEFDKYFLVKPDGKSIPLTESFLEFASCHQLTLLLLTYFEQLPKTKWAEHLTTQLESLRNVLTRLHTLYHKYKTYEFISVTFERSFKTKLFTNNYYPTQNQLRFRGVGKRFSVGGTLEMLLKGQRNTLNLLTVLKLLRVQVFEMVYSFFPSHVETFDPNVAFYRINSTVRSNGTFSGFVADMLTIYRDVKDWSSSLEELDLNKFESVIHETLNIEYKEMQEHQSKEVNEDGEDEEEVPKKEQQKYTMKPKPIMLPPKDAWKTGNPVIGFNRVVKETEETEETEEFEQSQRQYVHRGRGSGFRGGFGFRGRSSGFRGRSSGFRGRGTGRMQTRWNSSESK